MSVINKLKFYYRRLRRFVWILKSKVSNSYQLEDMESGDKNLLFVVHSGLRGGAPMLGLRIIEELKKRGYKIAIVIIEPGEMVAEYASLGHVYIPLTKGKLRKFLSQIGHWNSKQCIANSCLTGEYADVIKESGFQIVTLVHEMEETIKSRCILDYLKSVFDCSENVVFASTVVADSCTKLLKNIDLKNVHIRPQGIYQWEHPFKIDKINAKKEMAQKYNFDFAKELIVNAGGICKRKGFDIFLKACKMDPDRIWMWIGVKENTFYKDTLRRIEKMPDNFISIGFLHKPTEIAKIYEAADVLAMTSREDPFPSVVLESFSLGTPVVAFDHCGGFTDIINNGETGYLSESVTPEGLLRSIESTLQNKEKYQKMSMACREIAKEMSFSNYVTYLENLFK